MIPPTPLILVRHGETDWNVASRLQGRKDIPLNARGRDQAAAVGRLLGTEIPDLAERPFFASPLVRAIETARIMRETAGLDPKRLTTDDRLAELAFGVWEGATIGELREREPGAMRARAGARWTHRPPGGESYEDVENRLSLFFASIVEPSVIIAHGGVIRAALGLLTATSRERLVALRVRQGRAIVLDAGAWRWI